MIQAKIVADSVNEFGNRITTMMVTFPRFILAELNTHRMFSRNSASSRAIPFEKMLKSVKENPFIPIAWQKDHKGMQGTEYLDDNMLHPQYKDGSCLYYADIAWREALQSAISTAKELAKSQVTKQLCNRLLEPFMWHTVLITATEFENFFALRCPRYQKMDGDGEFLDEYERSKKDWCNNWNEKHSSQIKTHYVEDYSDLQWLKLNKGQAEIHMMALAEAMWDAYNESTPKQLKAGEWHIPFGDQINIIDKSKIDAEGYTTLLTEEGKKVSYNDLLLMYDIKIATAMCARVSYTVVGEENKPADYEADIKLHDRLRASGHMSPFEHIAQAMAEGDFRTSINTSFENRKDGYSSYGWSGNLRGFIQYRKTLADENFSQKLYEQKG